PSKSGECQRLVPATFGCSTARGGLVHGGRGGKSVVRGREGTWPRGRGRRRGVTDRAGSLTGRRRRSAARTHYHIHRQHYVFAGGLPGGDLCIEHSNLLLPHGMEVLVYRGQRGPELGSLGNIVEAHHRDVGGDAQTCFVDRPVQPQRHLVVGAEDGGDLPRADPWHEGSADLEPRGGAPVAVQHLGHLATRLL